MNNTHRPCLVLAVVFSGGILLGKYSQMPCWGWGLGLMVLLVVYFRQRKLSWLYAAIFVLGALWMAQRLLLPADSLAFFSYSKTRQVDAIEGTVADADDGLIEVSRLYLAQGWEKAGGKVKLRAWGRQGPALEYGQRLMIEGKLFPIHDFRQGSFSYRRYLQERGIFWMFSPKKDGVKVIAAQGGNPLMAAAVRVRRGISTVFERYLEPREASFVSALVIGQRRSMPQDLKAIFVNTGTAHILAISGMNMAVIVSVFLFIFQLTWLERRWKMAMTIIFLFIYAFISGWSASVVRACIMSAVLLLSFAFEDEVEPLNTLGLAALILLLLDPNNIADVGFELSFAAVLGILILTKPVENKLPSLPVLIRTPIAVSIAAFMTTTPIMAWHFHIVTPISILANIPIVPLADLVMALGLLLLGASHWPALAMIVAAALKAVLSLMVLSALWFSQVPFGCWKF